MTTSDAVAWRRALGLVGLGVRARMVAVGVERVRNAAKRGKLQLAVVARDASRHSLNKVLPLLAARGVPLVDGVSAAALGGAVGRDAAVVIGIVDAELAKGIRGIVGSASQARAQGRMA